MGAQDDSRPPKAPYRIECEKLVLRCFELSDTAALLEATLANREHLLPWLPWADKPPTDMDDQLAIVRRLRSAFDRDQDYSFSVWTRDESALVGGCGLHRRAGEGGLEIGYWVHLDHLRRGHGTEMASAMTRVGFELFCMDRIEIHCEPTNLPSRRIPEKLGYTHEGTLRRRIPMLDAPARDKQVWCLMSEDYLTSPSASCVLAAYDALGRRLS